MDVCGTSDATANYKGKFVCSPACPCLARVQVRGLVLQQAEKLAGVPAMPRWRPLPRQSLVCSCWE